MKNILNTQLEKANINNKLDTKPISSVFPNGVFLENSSNPYKFIGDSNKKSYLDKFSNTKNSINIFLTRHKN